MPILFESYLSSAVTATAINDAIEARNAPMIAEKHAALLQLRTQSKAKQGLDASLDLYKRMHKLQAEISGLRMEPWQASLSPSTSIDLAMIPTE